jgi:hypothetical protein
MPFDIPEIFQFSLLRRIFDQMVTSESKLNSEFQNSEKYAALRRANWKKIQQLKPLANAVWLSDVAREKDL